MESISPREKPEERRMMEKEQMNFKGGDWFEERDTPIPGS